MIKKSEWAEYDQRKENFPAIKLTDGDEVLNVEQESLETEDTIMIVTKDGICLNAFTDDIPVQGRQATGVRGISLRDGDEVVFMSQIDDEGEVVLATSEGRFKRVCVSQIKKAKRYGKGSIIVGLADGAQVISASYVTVPYMLAVVDKQENVSELSTERVQILTQSNRAQKIPAYKEGSVARVFPMFYKKGE